MASSTPPSGPPQAPPTAPVQPSPLEVLEADRTGGAYMIRGARYQTYYAIWRMLHEFFSEESDPTIRREVLLERLEDVDVVRTTIVDGDETNRSRECFQAKSSAIWNSSSFWDSKVLQNFAQAYLADEDSILTFRVVHQAPIPSKGYLLALIRACGTGPPLTGTDFHHWNNEFNHYFDHDKVGKTLDRDRFSLNDLLRRIRFQRIQSDDLFAEIRDQITTGFSIPSDGQILYVDTLVSRTLEWSESRSQVTIEDIRELVQEVTDDILKGLDRLVVEGGRLAPVSFEAPLKAGDEDRYFSGSAARPEHIGAELPVRRLDWERQIRKIFDENDVTVIRASSGQGKSTLAWQVVKEFSEVGWTPYELFRCEGSGRVDHIAAFLKSRVDGGEKPLVVLDGLRSNLKAWKDLAECTRDLPVKYVVTTREEDWTRFGANPLGLRLREISLEMTREEAEAIYESLKKKEKLHESAPAWQEAWDQTKGLLIEYVALVTRGEMLKERIERQIAALGKEPDAKACFEILRLVSLADVLGLRLSEESLVQYVEERVEFEGPPGEVLRRLDDEFLKVDEEMYEVRGVHPVRSGHLSDRLNSSYRLKESLIELIGLIDSGDLFHFCAQAPLLLPEAQRGSFLSALSEYLAKRSYPQIVSAIEGTFVADAYLHWEANKDVYSQVDQSEDLTMVLFLMATFRWSTMKDIIDLPFFSETGAEATKRLRDEMSLFDPSSSLTMQLLNPLQRLLRRETPPTGGDFKALRLLEFWVYQFDLPSPLFSRLDISELLLLMEPFGHDQDLSALFGLLPFISPAGIDKLPSNPPGFERLCRALDILRIWESPRGDELYFEYFVEDDGNSSIQEQIVTRLAAIVRFLPGYVRYHPIELRPPSSHDFLPASSPYDPSTPFNEGGFLPLSFLSRVNSFWVKTIEHQYAISLYEWQMRWREFRLSSLEFVQALCGLLEERLAQADHGANSVDEIDTLSQQVLHRLSEIRYPSFHRYPSVEEPFSEAISSLGSIVFPWKSFLSDFRDLLDPSSHSASLHSARSCVDQLRELVQLKWVPFQAAYRTILEETTSHFDPTELESQELKWYRRLHDLVLYFYEQTPIQDPVRDPARTAQNWVETQNRSRLQAIRHILDQIESTTGIRIVVADQILYQPPRRKVILGVYADSFAESTQLFLALSLLLQVDVGLFCIYFIHDDQIVSDPYLPLYRDDLEEILRAIQLYSIGQPYTPVILPVLLPIEPEDVALLPGLKSQTQTVQERSLHLDSFKKLFRAVWEWTEVQRCLAANPTDPSRLKGLASKFYEEAEAARDVLKSKGIEGTVFQSHVETLESVLREEIPSSPELFQSIADRF